MPRRLVEDTPRLRMAALTRAGLFRSAKGEVALTLDGSDAAVRVARDGERALRFEWEGGAQRIELGVHRLRYGLRRYFLRPDGEGVCLALYLGPDGFSGRHALGLAYAVQRMDAQGRAECIGDPAAPRLRPGPSG